MRIEDFKRSGSGGVFFLKEEKVPLLKFHLLEETGIVEHGFTTREGGVSTGIFSSLNLSYTRGDDRYAVDENFRRTAMSLHASVEDFVLTDQTHTTHIRLVTARDRGKGITEKRDYQDIDGLITDEPGIVLAAFFADCVPLFFVDPAHHAIGLSHSGWRGTVSRMGRETIRAMHEAYGSRPEDLVCAIGPSVCQSWVPGKFQLDLWKANELVLKEAGVTPEHLAVTDICTCCNPDLLFSHRASHGKRGNLGAFLKLKLPASGVLTDQ